MCDYRSETTNFTWDRALVLGRGTVGCVFQGMRKGTSERVAVKCFTGVGHDRSIHLKLREIDVMRKLDHDNIVKVLAVEDELFPTTGRPNGKKALILELCTGGSLACALRKPENHYGLPEPDFLSVWEHLTNAMQHLRNLRICHRDLKPANILILIKENGTKVYKLADFDTARELDEGESFPSIVGTVPYLNPQMYQRALGQIPGGENCSTSVDLWSIGVTLYETATGKLPFRSHNWNAKNGLCEVLKGKPSGAISGVQNGPNGPILYATTFPTTSLLSVGLQTLLAPIIAFLCESNEGEQWTYRKYFTESYDVLRRKRVHIFYLNRAQSLCVYLKFKPSPGKGLEPYYSDLVTAIQDHTKVPVESQVLFYKNSQLLSFLEKDRSLRPIQTTEDTPLILWNCKSEVISTSPIPTARKFKQFGNVPDIYADAKTGTVNMKNAYVQKRKLEWMSQQIHFLHTAVSTLNQHIIEVLIQISKESSSASTLSTSLGEHFELTKAFVGLCKSLLTSVQTLQAQKKEAAPYEKVLDKFKGSLEKMETERTRYYSEFKKLKSGLKGLTSSLNQLTTTRIQNRSLVLFWDELIKPVADIGNVNEFLKTGSKLMSEMELSFNILQPEVKAGSTMEPESISHAREYYRHIERLKMPPTYQSYSNLSAAFQNLYESILRKFAEWYNTAYYVSMQPEILKGHLTSYRENFEHMEANLTRLTLPRFRADLDEFGRKLKDFVAVAELKSASKDYRKKCKTTQTLVGQGSSTNSRKFMDNLQNLAGSPAALQLELEKNSAMMDESLTLLSSLVSKLTTENF